jgi:hypothetical protein
MVYVVTSNFKATTKGCSLSFASIPSGKWKFIFQIRNIHFMFPRKVGGEFMKLKCNLMSTKNVGVSIGIHIPRMFSY